MKHPKFNFDLENDRLIDDYDDDDYLSDDSSSSSNRSHADTDNNAELSGNSSNSANDDNSVSDFIKRSLRGITVRKTSGSKSKHRGKKRIRPIKVIKRVIFIAVLCGFATLLISWGYSNYQYQRIADLALNVDDTLTSRELGIDDAKKLAKMLVIHDSKSYSWVLENIPMTESVRNVHFPTAEFTGTAIADEYAPTYEILDVLYDCDSVTEPTYFLMVNVTSNSVIKTYYIIGTFSNGVLTKLYIY